MAALSDYLADPDFAATKNAQVTLTLSVDTGRPDQTIRQFRIFAAKSISLAFQTNPSAYTMTITPTGNRLSPDVSYSTLQVTMNQPFDGPVENTITLELLLDGTPLRSDAGTAYIIAVAADGQHVYRRPNDNGDGPNDYEKYLGAREDLHPGNEDDADLSAYPSTDEWLHSTISAIDVLLVDRQIVDLNLRPVYNSGYYSSV